MKNLTKKRLPILLVLLAVLTLPACGEDQSVPEQEADVLIYAALNPASAVLERTVARFNENHEDVQIEIHDYSDEGGRERLQIELLLGQVPDIMEMCYYGESGNDNPQPYKQTHLPGSYEGPEDGYWMPYRQMAQKGYLEDLWPYIENDPDLGREAVVEAPLKAAEVNGGLYILFQRTEILTLIGRESVVGERYSWTLDDMMEAYAAMPVGSTILRYNMTKQQAFFNLLSYSLERFVDRATGKCNFDSKGFRDLVGLLAELPDEVDDEMAQAAEEEVRWRIWAGEQMLEGMLIAWPREIGISDSIFQERAAFPGYPTADGSSGSFFYPTDTVLAMSSTCRNKEAAWEYIRRLIMPSIRKNGSFVFYNMPVSRNDFEVIIWYELYFAEDLALNFPENPLIHMPTRRHFYYGQEVALMELINEDHIQRFRDLVDNTTQLYWPEDDLANIVWETLGAYFAGDRTLDDTIQLIQNRVQLYLNENR